jgi:hypothetical protein
MIHAKKRMEIETKKSHQKSRQDLDEDRASGRERVHVQLHPLILPFGNRALAPAIRP